MQAKKKIAKKLVNQTRLRVLMVVLQRFTCFLPKKIPFFSFVPNI